MSPLYLWFSRFMSWAKGSPSLKMMTWIGRFSIVVILLLPLNIQAETNSSIRIIGGDRSIESLAGQIDKLNGFINKQHRRWVSKLDIQSPGQVVDSLTIALVLDKEGHVVEHSWMTTSVPDMDFRKSIDEFIPGLRFAFSEDSSKIEATLLVQNEKQQKWLGFGLDLPSYWMRDKVFSPLTYGGRSLGGTFFMRTRGVKSLRTSYTSFSWGSVNNEVSKREFTHIHFDGQEDYYRRIYSRPNITVFLGGLFDSHVDVIFNDIPTWSMTYSLNIACYSELQLNSRQGFNLKVFTPLLAYSNRPAWGLFDDDVLNMSVIRFLTRGKLTSIGGYRKISIKAEYHHRVSEKWRIMLGYDFHYIFVADPQVSKSIFSKLQIGVIYGK